MYLAGLYIALWFQALLVIMKQLPVADYARIIEWLMKYSRNTKVHFGTILPHLCVLCIPYWVFSVKVKFFVPYCVFMCIIYLERPSPK